MRRANALGPEGVLTPVIRPGVIHAAVIHPGAFDQALGRVLFAPTAAPPPPPPPPAAFGIFTRRGVLGGHGGNRRRLGEHGLLGNLLFGFHRERRGEIRCHRCRRFDRRWRAQPLDAHLRRAQAVIGRKAHMHPAALFDLAEPIALVIQDVEGDGACDMDQNLAGAALGAFLVDAPQHVQGGILGRAHMAESAAMRTRDEAGLGERGPQPLPAHFQQTEMADMADLDARAVAFQRLLQPALDHRVVLFRLHVDEVDDDQAGEIAQTQLPRHFLRGLHVGAQGGIFDVTLARRAAGIDVDRDQRLGLVDDQITAGAQRHGRRQHRVELRLDLVAGEQRLSAGAVVAPGDHLAGMRRHQHAHELVRGLEAGFAIDDNLVEIARIDIADGALDERGFLVDQCRRHRPHRRFANVVPQAQKIFAVAFDLGLRSVGSGGTHDQAHRIGDLEFADDILQPPAICGGGDLARDAATPRRVRHQHAEPAGERDVGGERGALVAALLLDHLYQKNLAPMDDFLDLVVAQEARRNAALAHLVGAVAIAADRLGGRRVAGDLVETAFTGRRFVARRRLVAADALGAVCRPVVAKHHGRWLGGRRDRLAGEAIGDDGGRHRGCGGRFGRVAVGGVIGLGRAGLRLAVRFGGRLVLRRGPGFAAACGIGAAWGLGAEHLRGRRRLERGLRFVAGGFVTGLLDLHRQQSLPVGDRNLVIIRVDFAKCEKAVTVAAVFDEGGLETRFYANNPGKVDVSLDLPLG